MAHRSLGIVLLNLDEAQLGVEHLERAAQLEPNDGAVYSGLARGYQMIGDRPRAEEAAEKAGILRPTLDVPDPVRYTVDKMEMSPIGCTRRAELALRQQDHAAAIPDLERLVEMLPDESRWSLQLARSLEAIGQVDRARAEYDRAIERHGDLDAELPEGG